MTKLEILKLIEDRYITDLISISEYLNNEKLLKETTIDTLTIAGFITKTGASDFLKSLSNKTLVVTKEEEIVTKEEEIVTKEEEIVTKEEEIVIEEEVVTKKSSKNNKKSSQLIEEDIVVDEGEDE